MRKVEVITQILNANDLTAQENQALLKKLKNALKTRLGVEKSRARRKTCGAELFKCGWEQRFLKIKLGFA